jgi:hypothetical protein
MNIQDHMHDAIDVVLNWDIPEEALPDAVMAQAGLMARINPEEIRGASLD